MNPLETLEVLIEADYHGLETSLKQGLSKIYQFVDSANSQSINWGSILSGTMTPALIATIASTFAMSIQQALQFQNALQGASLSTKDSFAANTANMTNSIYDMSAGTGQSANDIAKAMGIVGQTFKNSATAQGILNVVSQEAFIRHQNIVDVARQLIPLFQQWGVNTVPEASDSMAVLNDSVKNGTITFDDLINGLTNAGVALHKYTSLSQAAAQTELVSAAPGMDSKTALQGLAATASAIENPLGQAAVLLGNMADIVKKGGMVGAFEDIAKKIQLAGDVANQLYGSIGLDQQSVQHFKQTAVPDIEAVAAAAAVLILKHESLSDQVKINTTQMDKMKESWRTFIADIQKFEVPAALKTLTGILDSLDYAFDALNDPIKTFKATLDGLKDEGASGFFKDLGKNLLSADDALTFGLFSKLIPQSVLDSIGYHRGGSDNAASTSPVSQQTNTTYNIGAVNVSGSGGNDGKLKSLLPGVPSTALPKTQ